MSNIVVELISQTASFRNPDFQNFHKSLELPPPTTVVGMVGAAFGFSALKAQEYFMENDIQLGIYGYSVGKTTDLWMYSKALQKVTETIKLNDDNITVRTTPYTSLTKRFNKTKTPSGTDTHFGIISREQLVRCYVLLSFISNSMIIEQISRAFHNPVYALTLGNSDSLVKIVNVEKNITEGESNEIENSIIEGNVIDDVMRLASNKMEFSIYQTSEPLAYDLPVSFHYENDYGKRRVERIKTYSFIREKMKLNYYIKGLHYKGVFIPTINLQ